MTTNTKKNCREVTSELKLKQAELQVEIELRKKSEEDLLKSEKHLRETNKVLTLAGGIATNIINEETNIDIDSILEKIGTTLHQSKIFLYRFSDTIEEYKEWQLNESHNHKQSLSDSCYGKDLTGLMNWVYQKVPYCGFAKELPEFFNPILCQRNKQICQKCYSMLIPVHIKSKPWGIIGFSSHRKSKCPLIVKEAFINLANLVAYLIKSSEANKKILTEINLRLTKVAHMLT